MSNPLLSDRNIEFLLYEFLDAPQLTKLSAFEDHSKETFDMYLTSVRKLAREVLYPAYKPMDEDAPELIDGAVKTHPVMKDLYAQMTELGVLTATRPAEVGGVQLPLTVGTLASGYLMAANLGAYAFLGLTIGAARLIESFGSEELKQAYMQPMYEGRWTGTMALTEPQAGSSLSDVVTKATPTDDGHYLLSGNKIFLSGGDQSFTDNIVHMTLARIEGAPAGTRGISLFAIPKIRADGSVNDVTTSGLFHKIGWRGIPSIAVTFGENDGCHGYLVGEPHRGLSYMFQMMNEARLMVGMNAAATAAVAYQEALDYARNRPQGRRIAAKDPTAPQVPIIEHADVRRMLLAQKSIVEGSLALLAKVSWFSDLAEHAADENERKRAHRLVELLTPVSKTFPAEKGFEANALAVQVHGGYGYTSEYMPESWLRDQKLNSIHEGTTGIQGLDLLGRKVVRDGGAALMAFGEEIQKTVAKAQDAGISQSWIDDLQSGFQTVGELTARLGGYGAAGDIDKMTMHSAHYLELFSTLVIAWVWLEQATVAKQGQTNRPADSDFYEGKLCAAQYWINTELPRLESLAKLCGDAEDSYARMKDAWF